VVIPTRNRPHLLAGLLSAVATAVRSIDEVIVVDSDSDAGAAREIARLAADGGATLVRCDTAGASRARNEGWRRATHDIVVFTDDDCRPRPGWTAAMASAFDDPAVGIAGGAVVAPAAAAIAVSLAPLDASDRRVVRSVVDPATVGHGANLAFRVAGLAMVGGWDEQMGPGARFPAAEDHDLVWRVSRCGWHTAIEPEAVVEHEQWRTTRAAVGVQFAYGVGAGALLVKRARTTALPLRGALRDPVWASGWRRALRQLVTGNERAALVDAVRATGVAAGARRARRVALDDSLRFV
jgi:cellulose synthase/poly-beta-1,6-N-acetylglucosamine synthase-like glycosyltransferase